MPIRIKKDRKVQYGVVSPVVSPLGLILINDLVQCVVSRLAFVLPDYYQI